MSTNPYQPILDDIDNAKTVMKEKVFKAFIPFLFERKTIDEKTYRWYLDKWLDIVKDPRTEAWICSDDDMDTVLHRIPPLAYTNDQIIGRGIGNLLAELELHRNVSPKHGERFAKKINFKELIKGKPTPKDIEDWRFLANKYFKGTANEVGSGDVGLEDEEW